MKEHMPRHRNARRHASPGRGPFPVHTPGPNFHATHARHSQLCNLQEERGLEPDEVTELIDLRVATGRAVRPRNAFGEVMG